MSLKLNSRRLTSQYYQTKMDIQKQLTDYIETDLPMTVFLPEVLAEVELKENLVEAFRAGEITANEMAVIWKEDSIKI